MIKMHYKLFTCIPEHKHYVLWLNVKLLTIGLNLGQFMFLNRINRIFSFKHVFDVSGLPLTSGTTANY